MQLSDTNPHRRNLSVMSIFFLIYYLGGAAPDNVGSIKLSMFSVTLQRPEVLGVLAWFLLLWLAYRYLQDSHEIMAKWLEEAVVKLSKSDKLFWRYSSKECKTSDLRPYAKFYKAEVSVKGFKGTYHEVDTIKNALNQEKDGSMINCRTIEISMSPALAFMILWLWVKAIFIKPGFFDIFSPAILFILALLASRYGTFFGKLII